VRRVGPLLPAWTKRGSGAARGRETSSKNQDRPGGTGARDSPRSQQRRAAGDALACFWEQIKRASSSLVFFLDAMETGRARAPDSLLALRPSDLEGPTCRGG
jgi:hypothetical protein